MQAGRIVGPTNKHGSGRRSRNEQSRRYRPGVADSVQRLISDLLVELRRQPLDTAWSSYSDSDALIRDVEALAERLKAGDKAAQQELRVLFLPTGDLQETAMSSGWHDEYMRLAD